MIEKRWDQIVREDLLRLVENKVPEGRTLDYKEAIHRGANDEKKEFLRDVASFANATGGDMIFGVREERDDRGPTGMPAAADGLAGVNVDEAIRRLESQIRDGIAPRIAGVLFRAVDGLSAGPALIIRIPRSWTAPHMVTFQTTPVFYSRGTRGKYPMDHPQIRSAFGLGGTVAQRVRDFRAERVDRIACGETPIRLSAGPRLVLHAIPIASIDGNSRADLTPVSRQISMVPPLRPAILNYRFNLDGFMTWDAPPRGGDAESYGLLFRSGAFEAAATLNLSPSQDGRSFIRSAAVESAVVETVTRVLATQAELGIGPPTVILMSLVGVRGAFVLGASGSSIVHGEPIDRDTLLLPDVLVEDAYGDVPRLLRPAFDAFWQAGGWDGSKTYDEHGHWNPNH